MTADWLVINRNRLIAWQKERYSLPKTNDIKLNLGSGHIRLPGYINVDKYTKEAEVDADINNLPFPTGSVSEISCHHALEHLAQRNFISTLAEWSRVLKPGGLLDLGVPDIELCSDSFKSATEEEKWRWYIYTIYGYQIEPETRDIRNAPINEGQFHKSGATYSRLSAVLRDLGLEIIDGFNYDAYDTPSVWILAKKKDTAVVRVPSALEQDVVMGTFTNKTLYLDNLLNSIKIYLPHIPMIVKLQDNPINANMEALRQEFMSSGKRYWLFLDDDIRFISSEIVHNAIFNMIKYGWACVNVHSSFDISCLTRPYNETLKLIEDPGTREIGWATGYFVLVDSYKVGHIKPDLDLPYPNTSVDTSYSIAIRRAGYKVGLSKDVVYHERKNTPVDQTAVDVTNNYLKNKWGQFYYDYCKYDGNVLEWPKSQYK